MAFGMAWHLEDIHFLVPGLCCGTLASLSAGDKHFIHLFVTSQRCWKRRWPTPSQEVPNGPTQASASALGPQGPKEWALFLLRMNCSSVKGNFPTRLASCMIWIYLNIWKTCSCAYRKYYSVKC